jgi:hypothetical protein
MRRMWSTQERTYVIEHYATVGAVGLAGQVGRSANSISSQARRHGVSTPGYRVRQARARVEHSSSVNVRFFELATPETAYVVGYIWACGSIKTKHRKVLRVACPRSQVNGLCRIQSHLESRHLIQNNEFKSVLEICNSRVVESLLERFGKPPGRDRDGEPPRLDSRLLPHFAAGHMRATGYRGECVVEWRGHPSVIAWLGERIASKARVPRATYAHGTGRVTIGWDDPVHVEAIGTWLDGVD